MTIQLLPVGALQTNCYILATDAQNAIVIDPGANAQGIQEVLRKNGLTLKKIVVTHGHYDHIGAVTALQGEGVETWIPAEDEDLFFNPALTGSGVFTSFPGHAPAAPDHLYREGNDIVLDDITLKAMHTPGHTKGSYCLLGDGVLFSGDTLFEGSCGRTDLYGSDEAQMADSLRRLAALPGDWHLLPGHGPDTMLSKERISNPFLGTNYDDIF